jgi:protein-disulfide isomerase
MYNVGMKILIWVVLFFIVAVGALVMFGKGGSNPASEYALDSISSLDHVKGNARQNGAAGLASSTVILIEYSDFQCPACRTYYPILRELAETYDGRMAFVYRHYPLKQIHVNAEPAAWASEAAGIQGKFWEMHNLLFEKQAEWEKASDLRSVFSEYAALLGLNKEKFLAELDSSAVKNLVGDQRKSALKFGLNATPTFILNGKKIENPQSVEAFKLLIDKAIKEKVVRF